MNIKSVSLGVLLGVSLFVLAPDRALANCEEVVHDPSDPDRTVGTVFLITPPLDTNSIITRAMAYGCVAVGSGEEHESFTLQGTGQDLGYPNWLSSVCTVNIRQINTYTSTELYAPPSAWSMHEATDCDNGYKAQQATRYDSAESPDPVVTMFTIAGEGSQIHGNNKTTPTPTVATSLKASETTTTKGKAIKGASSPDQPVMEQSQVVNESSNGNSANKACFLWWCW